MKKMVDEGPTEEELERSKHNILGSLVLDRKER